MANYSVDPTTVDDGVQNLRAVTNKLEASLQALDNAAQAFLQSNKGQAIDGYHEAHQKWTAGMDEMQRALDGHSASLRSIGERYVQNDVRGRSFFQRN
jgi:WXG100 family type VII secretion target